MPLLNSTLFLKKSRLSLWNGEIGTVSGVIEIENKKEQHWVHVIFPETDKHYAYQQSFNSKDLIIVEEAVSCDCQDYEKGLVSNTCAVHNENPDVYGKDYK